MQTPQRRPAAGTRASSGAGVIAIEEHYWDAEMAALFTGAEAARPGPLADRLADLGAARIAAMDAAGIDMQVLSHGAPSAQRLAAEVAVPLTRRVNDRLHAAMAAHPGRFAGFAALPTADPAAAADELERCVETLGFKGAMLHGMAHGLFLDDRRFRPIFERAAQLRVPVYLHPSLPHAAVTSAYYDDYAADFPTVVRPAWGFTVETATTALRLILSGVFDAHPGLQIVLGHLGETLPFLLWRIESALARPGQKSIAFREILTHNFHVTTSGFFSTPALMCCVMELGVDRIMFAVDWPFVENAPAVDWMATVPLCEADRRRILGGNAKRLLGL
ncbi:amidohydrolase family protein [Rhodoplanes sp. TEM]|uniref:Amidohydrolase family protein n=1 Tax=Rhodoplanes tepidamans TaxID=200616 RepID=A0ABT5JBP9_RHOTP|nr:MULTISPECIES: amidohydrolase family protein [Rhodoplanes]MDC7787110.1 amidohydrolase family protein [Rhodoplanes tepidamans]MDC7988098.1 amidohydrolase family protein [Rhodoplanes sp. TEM]MDQ0358710.1 2,3-dihydroxybenzoate decarboxylase [Rhodoplanes tepidamans]